MANDDSIKVDLTDLVSSLSKFMAWNDEYQDIRERFASTDAAGHLMDTLGIPRENVRVLIGGSNAPIFKRAAEVIEKLKRENAELRATLDRITASHRQQRKDGDA